MLKKGVASLEKNVLIITVTENEATMLGEEYIRYKYFFLIKPMLAQKCITEKISYDVTNKKV